MTVRLPSETLTLRMMGDRDPAIDLDTLMLESEWSSSTVLMIEDSLFSESSSDESVVLPSTL